MSTSTTTTSSTSSAKPHKRSKRHPIPKQPATRGHHRANGNPLLKAIRTGSLRLDSTSTTVPNFFIDSFEIPPFLLPIYEAAGIEYQVPWPVLAAINQIETDYGRNLSVSTAGAVGWMQFMPSTWKRYGVDATGDGVADPYNPVDAIFSAARYLQAAGAATNLSRAIFAYNHAGWYVQSVLLRAKLIAGIPDQLVSSLSDLVEGRFPVAARSHWSSDDVVARAQAHRRTAQASTTVATGSATGTAILARRGSPVIAVNDGKIVALGRSRALGRYIRLQDATGNTYTYAHLGSVAARYPVPKPVKISAKDIAAELSVPKLKAPSQAATAGTQSAVRVSGTTITPTAESALASDPARASHRGAGRAPAHARHAPTHRAPAAAGTLKERLFAHPTRRASYEAGGRLQIHGARAITNFDNYFSGATLHLARGQYTLRRLRVGSIVVAGTILGRIGGRSQGMASHLWFQIQPAGRRSPDIDPAPILDGWKLLQATDIYRAKDTNAFYSSTARNPSVGQVLLMSKEQLIERVLSDPHVHIYACGRRDIAAGLVDRRVLAVLEFLADSGLRPTVSGLVCGAGRGSIDATGRSGESVDISQINGVPVAGHQGPGSITAVTIRRLLALQGLMAPDNIVSDTAFKGQSTVLALPDHTNRIQISFTPYYGADRKQSQQAQAYLKPSQWTKLIAHIGTIAEPSVPLTTSRYAVKR
ncbi:MAG TPA: lytic murein transglycosylase [Solirubrobacteraceae bacterium]|nr:lytic murein transglycosylase [Solirubrobacteraceae bacterium]